MLSFPPSPEHTTPSQNYARGRKAAHGTRPVPRFPLSRLFPNMITLMALCAGLSSLRFAFHHQWEHAVLSIVIAAFLDGMDGRIARLLKSTSSFGAQLDSFSDFISFGVAPAMVLYLWTLQSIAIRGLGWGLVLCYTMCCAIRLARFNVQLEEEDSNLAAWQKHFFFGIPSPVGALLVLLPMMLQFEFDLDFKPYALGVGLYMGAVGCLMASRIPTLSIKHMAIDQGMTSFVLLGFGLLVASMILIPWITMPFMAVCYVALMPWVVLHHRRLVEQAELSSTDPLLVDAPHTEGKEATPHLARRTPAPASMNLNPPSDPS